MTATGDETTQSREGRLPFRGWETWYTIVDGGTVADGGDATGGGTALEGGTDAPSAAVEGGADGRRVPLLVLHGGPGIPHGYLDPLASLAHDGRDVVFYDQVGCGKSSRIDDPGLLTVDLFIDELENLRRRLGLDRVHLLGQSWGGFLALAYAIDRPDGLQSLILADTAPSMDQWVAEAGRLRDELPGDVKEALARHESEGTTDSREYEAAMMAFYTRHVCRLQPMPDYVQRAFEAMEKEPQVYETMWGPNEFTCAGTLRTWDVRDRLGDIDTPTLVLCGRYDEATPTIARSMADAIPGAELHIFEGSSHLPHAEEPEAFRSVVEEFLAGADRRG